MSLDRHDTNPSRARLAATLLTLVLPVAVVIGVDAASLVSELAQSRATVPLLPAIFSTLLTELIAQQPLFFGASLALSINLALAPRARLTWIPITVAIVASGALTAEAWFGMREYSPFARSHLVTAAFLFFGLALALAHTLLTRPVAGARLGRVIGVTAAAGAFAALFVDQTTFAARYHTLHRALLVCAAALLHAAVLGWIRRSPRPARPAFALGGVSALVTGLLLAALVAPLPPSTLPYLRAYTTFGRFHARGAIEQACEAPPAALAPGEALAVFEASSGLPALPEGFSLDDHNVLFITIEALRARDTFLEVPGATPALATFAERASVFRRAYTPSVSTVATLSSLLAMSHPSQLPLIVDDQEWATGLELERPTVPELLQAAGHHTFHVIGDFPAYRPLRRGFDVERTIEGNDATVDARIADAAIAAVDGALEGPAPFFGWIFFAGPHAPYADHGSGSGGELDRYRQEIAHTDAQLARLLAHVEARGLLEDTVVVITSDHGEAFGEHRTYRHASTVFEETARVPLVVYVPGEERATRSRPVSTLHVLPWLLLSASGAPRQAALERVTADLAPVMERLEGRALVEMIGRLNMRVALIGERHKLTYDMQAQLIRFFDLAQDPEEQDNLFEARPAALTGFARALERYLALRACVRRYAIR